MKKEYKKANTKKIRPDFDNALQLVTRTCFEEFFNATDELKQIHKRKAPFTFYAEIYDGIMEEKLKDQLDNERVITESDWYFLSNYRKERVKRYSVGKKLYYRSIEKGEPLTGILEEKEYLENERGIDSECKMDADDLQE